MWDIHVTDPPAVTTVIWALPVEPDPGLHVCASTVEIPGSFRELVESVDMCLYRIHLEGASLSILLVGLVEHLLECVYALRRDVVDVGDVSARDQRDLQFPEPIQRCRVGNGEGLENTWRVDWARRHDAVERVEVVVEAVESVGSVLSGD